VTQSFIQTVRGPIAPERLGVTLTHEHLVLDWDFAFGRAEQICSAHPAARILECLERARQTGVDSVVDVTPDPLRASPLLMALVAERTDMSLVVATGLYAAEVVPFPAWAYPPATAEDIAEHFVRAATFGLDGTGIKPGIIKVSTSRQAIHPGERLALEGAAIAQQRTGLAITTHADLTHFAEEQVDILQAAGADLSRVVIGHIGWGTTEADFDRHRMLAERGVNLGLDLVGQPARTVAAYARMAADLIAAGHADRLTFSHDETAYCRGAARLGELGLEWHKGDYTVVREQLVPALLAMGVGDDSIEQVMVRNPARILAVDPDRHPGARETVLWEPEVTDVLRRGEAL
jgi:phosphotriesterase-related protein